MAFFYKVLPSDIEYDIKEAARYAGYILKNDDEYENITSLVEESCKKMQSLLVPQAVYEYFDLSIERLDDEDSFLISFANLNFKSKSLGKNLFGCSKVVLIASTIGAKVDLMIRRAVQESTANGIIMQGTGAMFIESFVDKLNQKIKEEAKESEYFLCPRFSPGYGDVSIELQKDFFRLLPCNKIGLSLMDSMIMAPEKSVTAFIGLKKIAKGLS